MKAWVALLLLIVATASQAQIQPELRISVKPEVVAVGEPVTLEITVLVPTWFPTPPIYPAFELSNAITRQPPDSSYPTNERINGETWAGIVREYQIFPMLAATYQLTDQTMTVTYSDPQTRKPVKTRVEVPEFSFRAVVPPGAQTINPYLAGRSLALDLDIEGDPESLKAGDALVLQYTASLDGMPSMFLPPLIQWPEIPGVSIYADQAITEDGSVAKRSERLTLVFESGGDFTLPSVELEWWNSIDNRLETSSVPALTVSVVGPIAGRIQESAAPQPNWPLIWSMAVLLSSLVLAWHRWAGAVWRYWGNYQQQRLESEKHAYTQLQSALQSGDLRNTHSTLMIWIQHLNPALNAREFAHLYGDAQLQAKLEQLGRSLYSGSSESVDLKRLAKSLQIARRVYRSRPGNNQTTALPGLNP